MIDSLLRASPPAFKRPLVTAWSISRAALFVVESLPLLVINRRMFQENLAEMPQETRQLIATKTWEVFKEDAARFADSTYPAELLRAEQGAKEHSLNYFELLMDALGVAERKKKKQTKHFTDFDESALSEYPEYYRRNFHHQTDGYLSEKSARLYSHQVEILFHGAAAAMRRRFLVGLKEYLPGDGSGLRLGDIACGSGDSTRVLQAAYPMARIEGIDLSDAYLLQARSRLRKNPRVHFIQGQAETMPFKDERFDGLLCVYLFHEIPMGIRKQVIAEAWRTLMPGGILALVDTIQLRDEPRLKVPLTRFPKDFHEPFYRNYIENPVEDIATEQGFRVEQKDIGLFTKSLILRKPAD